MNLGDLLRERYGDVVDIGVERQDHCAEWVVRVGRACATVMDRELRASPGETLRRILAEIDDQLKARPYHLRFRPGRTRARLHRRAA